MSAGDRILAASVCRVLAVMAERKPYIFGAELLPPGLMRIAWDTTRRVYGPVVTNPRTRYDRDEAILALCLAADVLAE